MRLAGDVENGPAELDRLRAGEAHLWTADCGDGGPSCAWDAARVLLPAGEQEQLDRRVRAVDRSLYVTAHALLRAVLGHYLNVEPIAVALCAGVHGKPLLDHSVAIELSLTHSAGVVACFLALVGPVGVDVESATRSCRPLDIADRYFTESETAAIAAVPEVRRGRRFFLYWTVKEAVLKALGTGLTVPLHSVRCELLGRTRWGIVTAAGSQAGRARWRVAALALPSQHLVAVSALTARPFSVLRCRSVLVADQGLCRPRVIGADPESLTATRLVVGGEVRLVT